MKEVAALPFELFGDFDAHEPERKDFADQRWIESGALIHLADERRDAFTRESAHGIAEEFFIRGEFGERAWGRLVNGCCG